eukprot:TRINITY_DN3966_c0_g1_i1.p1 TRINITY_DN3966_c0_g1~~TRINITY_DN3966_c0_g1_i1.p1  ORF type:complete len:415 (-),score=74.60 TRINITY_DN3966_c0_g1_i1:30-1274(-)
MNNNMAVVLAGTVGVSYGVHRLLVHYHVGIRGRTIAAAGVCLPTLAALSWSNSAPYTFGTMMKTVLTFMVGVKAARLLMFPLYPRITPIQASSCGLQGDHDTPVICSDADSPQNDGSDEVPVVMSADTPPIVTSSSDDHEYAVVPPLQWLTEFIWYALPIRRQHPVPAPTQVAVSCVIDAVQSAALFIAFPVINRIASKVFHSAEFTEFLTQPLIPSTWLQYCGYTGLFGATMLASNGMNILMELAVRVVSLGRYEVTPFFNYTIFSTSLREFWARRYNLVISAYLKDVVYIPSRRFFSSSQSQAGLLTFATSGILHMFVSHHTFHGGLVRSFVFFALHGLLCSVEPRFIDSKKDSLIKRVLWTHGTFLLILPIYAGLFVDAMPGWADNNVMPEREFLRPIVDAITARVEPFFE